MSTIHICDRCAKRIVEGWHTASYHVQISEADKDTIYTWDLCPECKEIFELYMEDFYAYEHSNKEVKEWCGE